MKISRARFTTHLPLFLAPILLNVAGLSSCRSSGYSSSLNLSGSENREQLAQSVRRTVESQIETKNEFVDAFHRLEALGTPLPPEAETDVEELYVALQDQVDRCVRSFNETKREIETLEREGAELFQGWNAELEQFTSQGLRARSEARMNDARRRLEALLGRLWNGQDQMEGLLLSFHDYVLFFNHNLSAPSLATLEGENEALEEAVQSLETLLDGTLQDGQSFVDYLVGAPFGAQG